MLTQNEPLYPKNGTCKLCINKPCRELFKGRVFPGKMIFVHHGQFQSWPCHTPNLKPLEEENEEAPALTDDIEVTTEQVEVTNPRWKPLEEAEEGGDPEIPLLGDKVRLLADVKNYPDGASVSFDIYDVTEGTPLRITTVTGTNQGGTASAEWTVEDPQKRGEELKLQFEAGARSKYTEKADLPWQDKIRCDFVEMPDVLFHDNSAVPCLDEDGILLGAMAAAFIFSKQNPDKETVLFGHTDTTEDPSQNFDLSEWRAEGIRALLDGDAELWLDVIDLASKVEDYQAILKALSAAHGWDCDPGDVDNRIGPKTKAAVEAFQTKYKEEFKAPDTFKVDGVIGPKTWKAIFEVVRSIIETALNDEVGEKLPVLTYGYNGKGIYPCGESFRIDGSEKENYTSATNSRVEIVFFDKSKTPQLLEPADKTNIEKKEAPVYDTAKVERKVIQRSTTETAAVKTKTVLEVEDTLFNLNSAVMLPAAPDSTTSSQGTSNGEGIGFALLQKKTTGLNVLRAIYRFVEQYPDKKLLIAGHTDTSGEIKSNFELSDLRAENVMHLLLGEGDAWAETCFKRHQVEDYQQILKHYAHLLLWPCDPGKIDNEIGPLTRKAVTCFQELYNSNREYMGFSGNAIPVQEPSGNELDKETWRAFFDVYRWESAIITTGDQDPEGLNEFIGTISFVDENRKTLACGESFPIDQKDKDNYTSQKNRRVELLFFDEGEAPESIDCSEPGDVNYTPDDVPFYNKARYTTDYITTTGPSFIPTLDIQSVDSLGRPIRSSSMIITSDNKEIDPSYSKNISTDDDAFIRVFGIPVGTIEITDSNGNLLNMLVEGSEVPASIHTRKIMNGITSIIVQEVAAEVKEKYIRQRKTYSAVPTDDSTTLEPAGPREKQVQQLLNTGPNARFVATDNLLMAAGLNKNNKENIEGLVSETLHTWLADYYPVVIKRDYIVYHFYSVDSSFKLGVYNSKGKLLGTFDVVEKLVALVGAYSIFESIQEQIFVDMAYRRYKIVIDGSNQIHALETIVAENQQEDLSRLTRDNISKVQISYFCRSVAHLASISLVGGTGYLESYGESSGVMNRHIHERNIAVIKMHSLMYEVYINDYIKKVDACTDEDALRKLGPPMRIYHYPSPVKASNSQISELYQADNSSSAEYRAWLAIAKQINIFTDRRATGFYLLAKYSYSKNINKLQKVQFEYNFTLDSDGKKLEESDAKLLTGFETDIDTKLTNKLTKKNVVAGVEHEISLKTGDSKVTGKLKIGKYGFELASDGSAKCTNGPIATEVNPAEKTFGAGLDMDIGEGQKVYLGMHFQGLREDTVMAFVSNAPGFFERRSHKELLAKTTKWNDLNFSEQQKLEQLGFTMEFWDDKHNHSIQDFPPSANKKYNELDATCQVAVVHLGFNSTTWPSLIKGTAKQAGAFKPEPDVI